MDEPRECEIENQASIRARRRGRGRRRILREESRNFVAFAAHDRCVEAVARNRRIVREEPLRRPIVHPMIGLAVFVVIPARRLQETDDALCAMDVVLRPRRAAALDQRVRGLLLPLRGRPL